MHHLSSRRFSRSLIIGFVLLYLTRLLLSRAAAQANVDTDTLDRFIAEEMARHNLPGLAVAITHGEQLIFAQGYGRGYPGQPMTPQSQLLIASVSKSFTALAIMQLVEAGQIELDAPVQTYLPEFTLRDPTVASQITIRHLLNHTSGLADAGYPEGRLPPPATLEALLSSLAKARPVAAPGTEFHYFNPNYQILARVVEVVSGQPFSDYLQTHIFAPLQMTHTFNAITSQEALTRADALAQGYVMAFGFPIAVDEMRGFLGGSGGIASTAEDMANYLIMQNNGGSFAGASLLSPEGIQQMHTAPQTLESNYAMGWIETQHNGVRVLEHNGILSVYYADIVLLPQTGHGIILLYNTNSVAASLVATPRIKNGLIALLTGGQPQTGGVSLRTVGILLALATLAGLALAVRSLLRLPQWREKARMLPSWRLLLGLLGAFSPALIWLALPSLITATSGRAFSYLQLFRAMPGILIWLGIGAVLGTINGVSRILFLLRTKAR